MLAKLGTCKKFAECSLRLARTAHKFRIRIRRSLSFHDRLSDVAVRTLLHFTPRNCNIAIGYPSQTPYRLSSICMCQHCPLQVADPPHVNACLARTCELQAWH